MQKLRIAQLASYAGNFGDTANVAGTRHMLRRNLSELDLEFTNLEYLEYEPDPRWGGRSFDDNFARLVNSHDLLMIGGGGFFELSQDWSETGTPLDLSDRLLDRIRVPIVFHGLGLETGFGVNRKRLERFRRFLDRVVGDPRVLVSVRNDGSLQALVELLGTETSSGVSRIPDGGFFAQAASFKHAEIPAGCRIVSLNLAGDNLGLRFRARANSGRSERWVRQAYYTVKGRPQVPDLDRFLGHLSIVFRNVWDRHNDVHVVLVPHIPEDLRAIDRFIAAVGPPYSRRRLTVAPYVFGKRAAEYILDLYCRSELVLGMRFHANVCAIGLCVPTIGLASAFAKVKGVYQELGLGERVVSVRDREIDRRLLALVEDSLTGGGDVQLQYQGIRQRLEVELARFHGKIQALVSA